MNITPCENRPVLNPCTLKDRNYQVDPYIGCEHECYYCYALNQAETDWSKDVLMHILGVALPCDLTDQVAQQWIG